MNLVKDTVFLLLLLHHLLFSTCVSASSSDGHIILQQENIDFSELNTEGVSLEIYSGIEGNVLWKLSPNLIFSLNVKIYTDHDHQYDIPNETPKISIETNTTGDGISLFVHRKTIITHSPFTTSTANASYSNAVFVIIILLVTLDRKVALLIIFLTPFFSACIVRGLRGGPNIKCNVTIFYPRNLTFDKVNITIQDGTVTAPPVSLTNNRSLVACSTQPSIKGCPYCCHGNGICDIGNVCRCYPGFNDDTFCESKIKPVRKLFINDLDPRLAYFKSTNGATYLLHGRRRSSGTVKSLTRIRSRDSTGNELVMSLKNGKHVKSISSELKDNQKLLIRWNNKCISHTTYWIGTNVTEKLKVNVCSLTVNSTSAETKVLPQYFPNFFNNTVNQIHLKIPIAHPRRRRFQKKARIKIPLFVKRCGQPDTESTVYADVIRSGIDDGSGSSVRFKAVSSYIPGEFEVKLPIPSTVSDPMKRRMCKSFKKISRRLCLERTHNFEYNNEEIEKCKNLSQIFKENNVTSYFSADDVIEVCLLGIQRIDMLCGEMKNLIETDVCEDYFNIHENFYLDEKMPVVFSAYSATGKVVRSPVYNIMTSNNSAIANTVTKIVLEGNDSILRILNFTVSPKFPKANQRYKVTMHYSCARDTTKVHMRIEGSDNYSNYVTCNGIQKCNCCVLHVAAATSRVTDTVIVNVSDSALGFQFKKQFSITN